MSEFDPRAYMSAQTEAEQAKSSFKFDGLTISALLVMALAGGLFGYNTLMEFRHKNQNKFGQMMAEAEVKNQEREAHRQQQASVSGISLAANYANGMMESQKMANDVMGQLERNQRLQNVKLPQGNISDAKAFLAFPKTNAGEYAKYRSTQAMIKQCQYDGYSKTRLQNYRQQNAEQITSIKAAYGPANGLRVSRNGVPDSMKHIKTKEDAMKFVAGGGAQRHMADSMGAMAAMSGEPGLSGSLLMEMSKLGRAKLKTRRDYRGWSSGACNYLNQTLSSGKLNVKRRKA